MNRFDDNWDEHYITNRGGGRPTYYIIRRKNDKVGMISNYLIFAGHIRYALANGWLPVVDLQNYPCQYLEAELLGKVNAWERFFCQPLRIGLEEAYNGYNVILGTGYDGKHPLPLYRQPTLPQQR